MIKQIRSSLTTTALAMTPFLLSACGDDPNTQQKFEGALIPAIFILVSAFALLRKRPAAQALQAN